MPHVFTSLSTKYHDRRKSSDTSFCALERSVRRLPAARACTTPLGCDLTSRVRWLACGSREPQSFTAVRHALALGARWQPGCLGERSCSTVNEAVEISTGSKLVPAEDHLEPASLEELSRRCGRNRGAEIYRRPGWLIPAMPEKLRLVSLQLRNDVDATVVQRLPDAQIEVDFQAGLLVVELVG